MTKDVLDKAMKLDEEICKIKRILNSKTLYVRDDILDYHNDRHYYTTDGINAELRAILTRELERKEKEFAEL